MDREALLSWYREIQRPLPWRLEPSPWSILLSEILLQQTQMETIHILLLERTLNAVVLAYLKVIIMVFMTIIDQHFVL